MRVLEEARQAFAAIGESGLAVLYGRRVPTEAIRAEHRMEDLLAYDPLLEEFHRLRLFTPEELDDRNMWNEGLG